MKLIVALSTDTIKEMEEVKSQIEEINEVAWIQEQAEDDEEREMLNAKVIK